MAAYKTWQSWLKDHSIPKQSQVDNPIEVFVEACWFAATKSAEEKFASHNTVSLKLLDALLDIQLSIKNGDIMEAFNKVDEYVEQLQSIA